MTKGLAIPLLLAMARLTLFQILKSAECREWWLQYSLDKVTIPSCS